MQKGYPPDKRGDVNSACQRMKNRLVLIFRSTGEDHICALNEEEAIAQARLLKALADPTRLRILSLLSRHEGEVCVFEIVESFTLEQPTISHHLRILRDSGLVDCRKKGLWAYYYVRREALSRAREVISSLA